MSLQNTDIRRGKEHFARFLTMARDYGRAQGFKGNFLIEPKPMEPTKRQYDFASETVTGFLRHHGLDTDCKLNTETKHATLAQHTMDHEVQVAGDNGILGSIDANRGDYQNFWDTDQFPYNVTETVEMMLVLLRQGGGVIRCLNGNLQGGPLASSVIAPTSCSVTPATSARRESLTATCITYIFGPPLVDARHRCANA